MINYEEIKNNLMMKKSDFKNNIRNQNEVDYFYYKYNDISEQEKIEFEKFLDVIDDFYSDVTSETLKNEKFIKEYISLLYKLVNKDLSLLVIKEGISKVESIKIINSKEEPEFTKKIVFNRRCKFEILNRNNFYENINSFMNSVLINGFLINSFETSNVEEYKLLMNELIAVNPVFNATKENNLFNNLLLDLKKDYAKQALLLNDNLFRERFYFIFMENINNLKVEDFGFKFDINSIVDKYYDIVSLYENKYLNKDLLANKKFENLFQSVVFDLKKDIRFNKFSIKNQSSQMLILNIVENKGFSLGINSLNLNIMETKDIYEYNLLSDKITEKNFIPNFTFLSLKFYIDLLNLNSSEEEILIVKKHVSSIEEKLFSVVNNYMDSLDKDNLEIDFFENINLFYLLFDLTKELKINNQNILNDFSKKLRFIVSENIEAIVELKKSHVGLVSKVLLKDLEVFSLNNTFLPFNYLKFNDKAIKINKDELSKTTIVNPNSLENLYSSAFNGVEIYISKKHLIIETSIEHFSIERAVSLMLKSIIDNEDIINNSELKKSVESISDSWREYVLAEKMKLSKKTETSNLVRKKI